MNIPTWAIIIGSIVLYFLIGFICATMVAYLEGRKTDGFLTFFDGFSWAFFWPFVAVMVSIFFILDKYMDFLNRVKEYGKESMLPPKNECDGRRVS